MTLAPRLQQSVKLLQMSALEFTTAVQHALASNPFLEDPDDSEPESAAPAAPGIRGETADMEAAGAKAIAQTPEHLVELLREM